MNPSTQELLHLTDFSDFRHENFVFSMEGVEETVTGELVAVDFLEASAAPDTDRQPFSLQFKFRPDANIGQCLFHTEHPQKGSIAVFLVPFKSNDTGWYMEAIFN